MDLAEVFARGEAFTNVGKNYSEVLDAKYGCNRITLSFLFRFHFIASSARDL